MSETSSAHDTSWWKEQQSRFAGELRFGEPLARHTYYRIGGPAAVLALPTCEADLRWICEGLRSTGARHFIMGAGSNLLVSDSGFDGVVVRTSRLDLGIELLAPDRLRAGGSVTVASLLRKAMENGWGGLEFLAGIPGTVGGAVRMNAGTHLGEVKDRVRRVTTFGLQAGAGRTHEGEQLRFEYRKNLFLGTDELVLGAEWEIEQRDPAALKRTITEVLDRRKATQPVELPSCGSVFKNPPRATDGKGLSAWQVIDKLGLRGHRIGNAQISEKHSNFIVNLGGASAQDVLALIRLAQERARTELGIELEPEVLVV